MQLNHGYHLPWMVCVLQAAPCDRQLADDRHSGWSMPAEPLQSPRLMSSTADPDDPDVRPRNHNQVLFMSCMPDCPVAWHETPQSFHCIMTESHAEQSTVLACLRPRLYVIVLKQNPWLCVVFETSDVQAQGTEVTEAPQVCRPMVKLHLY